MSCNDNDSLCPDCREIDWKGLVERPLHQEKDWARPAPRIVKNMEKSHEKMKNSRCRSCRILSTIIKKDRKGFWNNNKFLQPKLEVTSLEIEANLDRSESRHGSVALLRTSGWGHWTGRYAELLGPGVDPDISKIPPLIKDFAWMRNSISGCRKKHKGCVNAAPSLPGLRVIDCLASSCTVSVVSAPDACQYSALSYVWGGVHATTTETPTVVRDAIKVTVELGLQYLWVDQYCIPQDDLQKHGLIRVMDKIYSSACVTIVAAAGKTSADGLPGVSTVLRTSQMETQIDGCTLFELPAALDSVQASAWASRGWTYQEGLLSTRCLVFTDTGVLYNCRERFVDENLQQLVSSATAASMKENKLLSTLFAATGTDCPQLQHRIVQYTERQLSYSQDSLNAILGIFADYEEQQEGLASSWRPRPEVPSVLSSPLDMAPQPSHIWGLPIQRGGSMLLWHHPLPPKQRRSDFPSWSWTGWEGGIKFEDSSGLSRHSSTDPTFAPTSIEIPNQLRGLYDRKIKGLYVTGATIELKFATQGQAQSIIQGIGRPPDTRNFPNYDIQTPRHHCLLEAFPGVFVAVRSTMSVKHAPQDQTIGLLVTTDFNGLFCARSMIVLKQCGQNFTRVGFIDAGDLWEHHAINYKGPSTGEELLDSDILWKYKFLNIDGRFVGREKLPGSLFGGLSFGHDFKRRRICLE